MGNATLDLNVEGIGAEYKNVGKARRRAESKEIGRAGRKWGGDYVTIRTDEYRMAALPRDGGPKG
jgi:hypothetical protein